jgi:phosphatidylinositol-bisphosphatase
LNYRIGGDYSDQEVMDIVEHNEWPSLLEQEQLVIQRELGNVFAGFEEGKVVFPPTYKFQPGTDRYERRPDKKLRAPAWCDRILWKSNMHVQQASKLLAYQSIAKLNISDHRPVHAWFETTIRQIVPNRMRNLYQDLLFNVDKWINASSPKLEISNRVFEIGEITMETRHRVTMELHNNGAVMTEWSFVPKNDDAHVAPPWLKFSPVDGILAPGERMTVTATILLTVELMANLFPTYAGGPLRLDEIVILRVKKGSDIFCIFSSVITEENIVETRHKAAQLALSIQHRSVRHDNPIPSRPSIPPRANFEAPITTSALVQSLEDGSSEEHSPMAPCPAVSSVHTRRSPVPSLSRNRAGGDPIVETDEDETDDAY